ncbi:MAG: hypothetical protein EOO04_36090 [Chitinophagaceae bacterium]|nr:MAG: hypothetical protein EOO04_36090 [Chitinophagaceae bacterium]
MRKQLYSLTILAFSLITILPSCSKDDDTPSDGPKTELLIKSSWKFQKAEAGILGDVSSEIEDCIKDNLLIFVSASTGATSGTGTLDEGTTKCDNADPQTRPFDWEFRNNGAVLYSSQVLFDGGSKEFNVVALNETNLVLSQQWTFEPGLPPVTVTITLKH